ncbi:MAG TPA: 2-amino-4-hydroxy-6-hydroxymethyldihydropteridine diphosphokinase [Candidatus Lustribacter sp.]|nr:2-amino-4-hydroxy-6-hydroxymethyldihydropteridine diphosphokinase [Candidatus Lustribacter sp.]
MRALLGLGANLGDPVATLNEAKARLANLGVVTAASALYRTPPWGVADQPPFVNAALALETQLDPEALLAALKTLERELGRVASVRWGPRAIDLDILDVDGVRRDDPHLTIPHARLFERAFALVPLAEIEPSFAAARDALPAADLAAVERIGAFDREGSR